MVKFEIILTITIIFLFVTGLLYAQTQEKIDELREEAQSLIQERERALQIIRNIERRLAQIEGSIQILNELEQKKDKGEGDVGTKQK